MYERSISYIDYFENDVRVKNIGFFKWESDGQMHTIQMKVNGLPKSDNMLVNIVTDNEQVLGTIHLENGRGEFLQRFTGTSIGKDQISVANINNMFMQFSPKRYGVIHWKHEEQKKEKTIAPNKYQKPRTVENKDNNTIQVSQQNMNEEHMNEQNIIHHNTNKHHFNEQDNETQKTNVNVNTNYDIIQEETVQEKVTVQEKANNTINNEDSIKMEKQLYDDKWKQLCHTYQVIHPFKGGQDYISISPKEFVIFREPYQRLVNNSFLLHGYYNYHHIIVGKIMKSGHEVYYLGVPGVYYDREKMAAEVFGFEGFESVDREITNGAFGYYLRKVEL